MTFVNNDNFRLYPTLLEPLKVHLNTAIIPLVLEYLYMIGQELNRGGRIIGVEEAEVIISRDPDKIIFFNTTLRVPTSVTCSIQVTLLRRAGNHFIGGNREETHLLRLNGSLQSYRSTKAQPLMTSYYPRTNEVFFADLYNRIYRTSLDQNGTMTLLGKMNDPIQVLTIRNDRVIAISKKEIKEWHLGSNFGIQLTPPKQVIPTHLVESEGEIVGENKHNLLFSTINENSLVLKERKPLPLHPSETVLAKDIDRGIFVTVMQMKFSDHDALPIFIHVWDLKKWTRLMTYEFQNHEMEVKACFLRGESLFLVLSEAIIYFQLEGIRCL